MPYPGTYQHIDRCGTFTIRSEDGKAWIRNNPSGVGTHYDHPLRIMRNTQKKVSYLYNTMFMGIYEKPWEHIWTP